MPARRPQSITEAIYRNNPDLVDQFLAQGHDPNEAAPRYRADRGVRTLPLTEAVVHGDVALMRKLIQAGADPNGRPGHWSPAAKAISHHRLDLLQLLKDAGADLNRDQAFGGLYASYLEEACSSGTPQIVDWLIEHGADVHASRESGFTLVHTPLFNGISERDKEVLRVLRDRGADLLAHAHDETTDEHYHPVSYVAAFGDGETLQWFLDAGADPNLVRDHAINGASQPEGTGLPLLGCVILGKGTDRAGMAQALIQAGATLDTRVDFNTNTQGPCAVLSQDRVPFPDNFRRILGGTYLTLAAAHGDVACVQLLLEQGLAVDAPDEAGITPLLAFACVVGRDRNAQSLEKLGVLLRAGANPNVPDAEGYTVVHHFASYGPMLANGASQSDQDWVLAAIELLLEHGADLRACNHKGETPLDVAWDGKRSNLVHERLRAKVEHEALNGETPAAPSRRARARF